MSDWTDHVKVVAELGLEMSRVAVERTERVLRVLVESGVPTASITVAHVPDHVRLVVVDGETVWCGGWDWDGYQAIWVEEIDAATRALGDLDRFLAARDLPTICPMCVSKMFDAFLAWRAAQ